MTFGGNDEHILRTLLAKAGLTENDVTLFSVRYDYTPFFQKKVNFWPVYRNSQAVFLSAKLREAGENYAFFNPVDYGVQFVANSVVTSRQLLETKPDLVRRFTVGLLKGWQAAMDPANSAKTIQAVQKFDKDSTIATLQEQLSITRILVHPTPKVALGTIDAAAWKQTSSAQKAMPASVVLDTISSMFGSAASAR